MLSRMAKVLRGEQDPMRVRMRRRFRFILFKRLYVEKILSSLFQILRLSDSAFIDNGLIQFRTR